MDIEMMDSEYDLIEAVQSKDIANVRKLLKYATHSPNILQVKGFGNCSPLFLAVKSSFPLDIINEMIRLCPNAASIQNNIGEIPLHVTTNLETAKTLIRIFPQGLFVQTNSKWLPIHTAKTPELTTLFLNEGSKLERGRRRNELMLFSKDHAGLTPIERLATSLEFCFSCSGIQLPLNHITSILWDKLYLLIRAMLNYFKFDADEIQLQAEILGNNNGEKFKMVHSWIELRELMPNGRDWHFFGLILEVALDLYPEQLLELDDSGRTPLSIAVSGECETSDDIENHSDGEMISYNTVESLLHRSTLPTMIRCSNRRLPLHQSILTKFPVYKRGGISKIVLAGPSALSQPDPITNLYPFMLAAASDASDEMSTRRQSKFQDGDCERKQLQTVYYLLREDPSQIELVDK